MVYLFCININLFICSRNCSCSSCNCICVVFIVFFIACVVLCAVFLFEFGVLFCVPCFCSECGVLFCVLCFCSSVVCYFVCYVSVRVWCVILCDVCYSCVVSYCSNTATRQKPHLQFE
jgi:hypothetical protein